MNVFISWSGDTSHQIAEALRDWLKCVIQSVEPWISSEDIEKGARWGAEIAKKLEQSKVGIICLTPTNLTSPWLLFEAGALSKTLENTFVIPYLYALEPANITGPLSQFQAARADKPETQRMVTTVNKALGGDAIEASVLERSFEKWWPELAGRLSMVSKMNPDTSKPPERPVQDILGELLEMTRRMSQRVELLEVRPESTTGHVSIPSGREFYVSIAGSDDELPRLRSSSRLRSAWNSVVSVILPPIDRHTRYHALFLGVSSERGVYVSVPVNELNDFYLEISDPGYHAVISTMLDEANGITIIPNPKDDGVN